MMLFRIRNIWYNIRKVKQGGHIMAADNEITRELNEVQGGRITFAPDVIETIASCRGRGRRRRRYGRRSC